MALRMVLLRFIVLLSAVLGSVANASELIPLRAGPVSMVFDADNVFLRYIRVGKHEVLRGINAPIRNQNWATIAPKVSNLHVEQRDDSFDVTFAVACQRDEIDFHWKGSISGTNQGVIEFTFDGESHSTFQKNRIGFCVLHGPSAAGHAWLLETVDGKRSAGRFPKFISPHQPAKNLRAITHEVADGIRARVAFEGDIFEMEDQRNWTDASFKTYCTPLEIPYPVKLVKGTQISQKICINVTGNFPEAASTDEHVVLTVGPEHGSLPLLGVQVSNEVESLTHQQIERLKPLYLDHLRVDLALSEPSFVRELRRATRQAGALGVSLQVVLGLGKSPDFETLIKELKQLRPHVSFWLVRGGITADFDTAREALALVAGDARFGVTRVTNFVELNRSRPASRPVQGAQVEPYVQAVGFAINPQIHAFDNASIVETLPIHADAVNSARQFTHGQPIIVGPITLTPQLLDGVDQPGGPPQGGRLPTWVDSRQVEPFTAVWTLGSLKYLADARTHAATFFETVGWNGIMDADDVSSRPQEFPSKPGELFPVYDLFLEVGEFGGASVRRVDTSDELAAVGLALHKSGKTRLLVGNLTGESQSIILRGLEGDTVNAETLGGEKIHVTPNQAINLPPYGIARVDQVVD